MGEKGQSLICTVKIIEVLEVTLTMGFEEAIGVGIDVQGRGLRSLFK